MSVDFNPIKSATRKIRIPSLTLPTLYKSYIIIIIIVYSEQQCFRLLFKRLISQVSLMKRVLNENSITTLKATVTDMVPGCSITWYFKSERCISANTSTAIENCGDSEVKYNNVLRLSDKPLNQIQHIP